MDHFHSIPALYWFTGSILPHNKIIEEKLLLLRHVSNLSGLLAAEVLAVQQQLELGDTLWSEGIEFLRQLNMSIDDLTSLSKAQFKAELKDTIKDKNADDLLNQIKNYQKLDYWQLKNEPFEMKKYFRELTLQDKRLK